MGVCGRRDVLRGYVAGSVNLWRIGVDPATLEWISGPDRLTTGSVPTARAPSPDGTRLAFVTRTETARLWALPFDAASRRVTAEGRPVTRSSLLTAFDLSADGRWLGLSSPGPEKKPSSCGHGPRDRHGDDAGGGTGIFAPRLSRDGASSRTGNIA